MAIGAPGKEQFRDAIVELRNVHIIAAMQPLIDMRGEITANDEFKMRGGLDNTTRDHIKQHLQRCDKWRRVVTYNPDGEAIDEKIKKAVDPTNLINGAKYAGESTKDPLKMEEKPFGADDIQSAPGPLRQIPWSLDGDDENIPLNSRLNFRNGAGFLLLQSVDAAIVGWTRLESRHSTRFITPFDSMRIYQYYVQILEYLEIFTGDVNRVDFAAGVRPTEEPRGAENSPNMASELAGTSGVKDTK